MNDNRQCYGCKYFQQGYGGDFSLENYTEPEPPACMHPSIDEITDTHEQIAIVLERILMQLSYLNNCPLRAEK